VTGPLAEAPLAEEELAEADAAERMAEHIRRGGYRPGDKLPSERGFMDLLGLSRTAVREGVKRLNQRGLVRSSVGRGLFVARRTGTAVLASLDTALHLEGGSLGEVQEARHTIEVSAARLAARRATPEDLAALREPLEEMERRGLEPGVQGRQGTAFHIGVARAAHNAVLLALTEPIMALVDRARPEMRWRGTEQGIRNHRLIYDAIAAGDEAAAAGAMERHLRYFERLLDEHVAGWRDLPVRPEPPQSLAGLA
jgi:GntR family transcriptional regulator, transcriptional repressor for pyruvate dehydrogenase complex